MKKLILLLVAILTFSVLVSCQQETPNNPDESETKAESTENPNGDEPKNEGPIRLTVEEKAKFYKVVEFDLPEGDFRDAVVEHMRKQASIKWACSANYSMKNTFGKNADWSVNLDYKRGKVYFGIPYGGYKLTYYQFEDILVNDRFTTDKTAWLEVPGVGCFKAVLNSIQQVQALDSDSYAAKFMPGRKDFIMLKVGDYKAAESAQSTKEILESNGSGTMYECYSLLKKGDIIFKKDFNKDAFHHIRVLTEDATVELTPAGKIIPSRSYVTTIEQTSSFDNTRKDGALTTWFVDHKYTFADLYGTDFVPLTIENYTKPLNEIEVPYIALDKEITAEILEKGTFSSTVKSNYPLGYVRIEIFDKAGKRVLETEKSYLQSTYALTLRSNFNSIFHELTAGEYTLILKAGIPRGTTELARVEFTQK